MASAEKTWYNHGTVTIPRPSLGGRGCWQHPRGHAGVLGRPHGRLDSLGPL